MAGWPKVVLRAGYKYCYYYIIFALCCEDMCRDNLRAAWPLLEEAGKTAAGRLLLTEAVGACEALRYAGDLPGWAQRPYFFMAEGNYPVK